MKHLKKFEHYFYDGECPKCECDPCECEESGEESRRISDEWLGRNSPDKMRRAAHDICPICDCDPCECDELDESNEEECEECNGEGCKECESTNEKKKFKPFWLKDKEDKKGGKKSDKDEKDEKPKKGLTAKQKKLPEAMQKAILAKQKK